MATLKALGWAALGNACLGLPVFAMNHWPEHPTFLAFSLFFWGVALMVVCAIQAVKQF